MIYLPQTLVEIAGTGGGLVINLDEHMLMPITMIQIAAAAARSGALITFKLHKSMLMPQTMLEISAAGRGRVVFDIG